ncbi:hypothetical protein CBR_g48331 [Chara braunii]|uniref:DUF7869 domain-containing protein n=1 Tax=Chara braunii TaxID=69332 RepID=A0A388K4J0_CHABU|nr:hypothetical protein CBR_g48331 [Chara braunii]|eukprot:GBG64863.1 hypothetical protein CBR_g48331 [Chara braunii]
MSENFVVKETLYDSVAQELRDNGTEEEEPSDDDDEEGESSDDDDKEEETSEDDDSEDTDSEDDEGKNESGIDVDMFKKSLSGELLGEAKQIIAQEVRRGLYSKSSKSEKPPYNLGKRGRNVRVYNKKANYHVNMKNVELVLKEDCCKANCYKKFTAVDVFYKREEFWAMKHSEQLNFFLAEMRVASYFSDEGDLEVLRVTFNGVKVCTKAWGKLYGCSTTQMFDKALEKHRLMQAEERQKLSKHRYKASSHPSEYVAMIIDGMDQSKTILPHFTRVPKDSKLKEGNFVKVHVVGAKVLGLSSNASATVFFDNFKSDSNCMLTVLHRQISQLPVPFFRVLYLTLDNTSKENKNKFVLSYLVFLVKMRVFSKVKLNFLLLGLTHEDIDQMFSCFSRKLAAHGAFDLPELQHVIRESYKVEQDHGVHVEEMTETMD